jgi:hypothetical protein
VNCAQAFELQDVPDRPRTQQGIASRKGTRHLLLWIGRGLPLQQSCDRLGRDNVPSDQHFGTVLIASISATSKSRMVRSSSAKTRALVRLSACVALFPLASCCEKSPILLVPGERIELPTNGLQNRCSTAELTRLVEHMTLRTRDASNTCRSEHMPFRPHGILLRHFAGAARAGVLAFDLTGIDRGALHKSSPGWDSP